MIVGICGLGFVGEAIYSFMNKTLCASYDIISDIVVYDKYKQINTLDALLHADLIYLCIPTPYNDICKSYNMDEIDNTLFLLKELAYPGIILIKSTILPNYCTAINNLYPQLKLIHNPEFLSAKTAAEDFLKQQHIILGYTSQSQTSVNVVTDFYRALFPHALISINTAEESALMKLACNSFYATKVQFFTELYLLCEKTQVDYNTVKGLMLNNNWINSMHTTIPGPDGEISFGGACLPKDISALNQYMAFNGVPNGVLNATIVERNLMR